MNFQLSEPRKGPLTAPRRELGQGQLCAINGHLTNEFATSRAISTRLVQAGAGKSLDQARPILGADEGSCRLDRGP